MTTSLLDNQLAPLTYCVGFLETPLQPLADAFRKWREGLRPTFEVIPVAEPLSAALRRLEPLTTIHRRELLLATASAWTAYFDNRVWGGDPISTVCYLSKVLRCRGVTIACIPHTHAKRGGQWTGTFGAVEFATYSAESYPLAERMIAVAHDDDGWGFTAGGPVLPFERTEQYQVDDVVERFTPEMLASYCAAWGIHPFDPGYYKPKGVLFQILDPLPPGHSSYSLGEARRLHNLGG
jgi:hypothetical protein